VLVIAIHRYDKKDFRTVAMLLLYTQRKLL